MGKRKHKKRRSKKQSKVKDMSLRKKLIDEQKLDLETDKEMSRQNIPKPKNAYKWYQ